MSAPTLVTEPQSEAHHVDALPAGSRLGEFEVVSLLGVGGFGMVYKAFDHSLLRFVAIKEYMPTALAARAHGQSLWVRSSSHEQSFQAGLASFVAEARLLAQFDHPSLVKVFRFWEANQTAYMVMPLYAGMTLKQARAHMRTPPPEAWLRKVLWSVLGALRVLHEGQTLHRDISPDNIFLQDSGLPVLLDLGAARHAITDHSHRLTAVLKVNYAPIEQYNDEGNDLRQGPWSDLYSVGAVVHGCLCNDTPLPATLRAIRDRMVPFSRVAKTVKRQFGVEYSPPFVAAVSQTLALQPQDRPQSIDDFLRTLEMTAPPEGMEQFDFRAELGDIWVEPADRRATGVAVPMIDITSVPAPMSGLPVPEPMAAPVLAPEPVAVTTVVRRGAAPPVEPERAPRDMAPGGDTVFLDSAAEAGDSWFEPAGVHRPGGTATPGAGKRPWTKPGLRRAGGRAHGSWRGWRPWLWSPPLAGDGGPRVPPTTSRRWRQRPCPGPRKRRSSRKRWSLLLLLRPLRPRGHPLPWRCRTPRPRVRQRPAPDPRQPPRRAQLRLRRLLRATARRCARRRRLPWRPPPPRPRHPRPRWRLRRHRSPPRA